MSSQDLLDFFLSIRSLMNVRRFSVYKCHVDEDVAQHSYFTALYAMILGDLERSRGRPVDMERLLRMALLHDAEESRTGDIHHPFKHEDEAFSKSIDDRALRWFQRLMGGLPEGLRSTYVGLRRKSRDPSELEAQILRAADKIEALLWAYEECMMRNVYVMKERIVEDIIAKLKEIRLGTVEDIVKEVEERLGRLA